MKNIKSIEQFINEELNQNIPQVSKTVGEYSRYTDKIDLTLLSPSTSIKSIEDLCQTANDEKVYSVCVPIDFAGYAKGYLEDSDVRVCTVIDFPKGEGKTSERINQTKEAIQKGVDEIDVVFNYKRFLKDDENAEEYLLNDLRDINSECTKNSVVLKVIIETGVLTYENIIRVCNICKKAGVEFIKTSTGMLNGDDSFEEKLKKVEIIRRNIPDYMKIKISGGIRNLDQLKRAYKVADRIGTSVIPKN